MKYFLRASAWVTLGFLALGAERFVGSALAASGFAHASEATPPPVKDLNLASFAEINAGNGRVVRVQVSLPEFEFSAGHGTYLVIVQGLKGEASSRKPDCQDLAMGEYSKQGAVRWSFGELGELVTFQCNWTSCYHFAFNSNFAGLAVKNSHTPMKPFEGELTPIEGLPSCSSVR